MRILVLAGLLAVAGSPAPSAQVQAPMPLLTPLVLAATYTIGPRDVLVINIFGDPTFLSSDTLAQSQQPVTEKVYVYVTGAVSKPGKYPLTEKMTALDLIDQAGGLLRSANDVIVIVSGTQKDAQGRPMVMRASVKSMKTPTAKQPVALLGPGDQVLVGGSSKFKLR